LKNLNLPKKAILLLDNCRAHPPAEELRTSDGMIFVMYMPPNLTPLIQPMDQNALRLTKLYYRKSLLSHIVSEEVGDAIMKLNLKKMDSKFDLSRGPVVTIGTANKSG
jgi:hypothetical protein